MPTEKAETKQSFVGSARNSFLDSPPKNGGKDQEETKKIEDHFKNVDAPPIFNSPGRPRVLSGAGGSASGAIQPDAQEELAEIQPLIFDLEDMECRMTDIEEEETHRSKMRDSVIKTLKEFPTIVPSGKINDDESSSLSKSHLDVRNF